MTKNHLLVLGLVSVATAASTETALDRYIKAPDPSYKYEVVAETPGKGYTAAVLRLTSQTWRSPLEVDRPVWTHWLTVFRPDSVQYKTALLYITGGANDNKPAPRPNSELAAIAATTRSVVAELRMVPNQPLTFAGDRPRVEDDLIAYTWDKYLRTGDETWPARLPMTKAAVRAMDAVSDYAKVDKFVVAGGSKRGWTTWTTAAVDNRVVAIAPLVIDMLNIEKSFEHHYSVYGFFAPAVKEYEDMHIMDWAGTKQYSSLMKIEEPYSYRERLTMPKMIINSTGDQFFLPDSSQFYFNELKGEKLLRYVPNTDHSLRNSDARQTLVAFYDAVLRGKPRPRYSWKINGDTIRVQTPDQPGEVKFWHATNAEKRDFRLETIGNAYTSAPVSESSDGVYIAKVPKPAKGWTAGFMELTFATGGPYPIKVTTDVKVIPETLPHKPYQPKREYISRPTR